MQNSIDNSEWYRYIETPLQSAGPVKIDHILAARMAAFMKARKVRTFVGRRTHHV